MQEASPSEVFRIEALCTYTHPSNTHHVIICLNKRTLILKYEFILSKLSFIKQNSFSEMFGILCV
jgi:hypothetical protein